MGEEEGNCHKLPWLGWQAIVEEPQEEKERSKRWRRGGEDFGSGMVTISFQKLLVVDVLRQFGIKFHKTLGKKLCAK